MFFLNVYALFVIVFQSISVLFTFFNQASIDEVVFANGVLEFNGNKVGWSLFKSMFYAFFLTTGVFIAIKISKKHHTRLKDKLSKQNKKDVIMFLKVLFFAFLCLCCFYLFDLLANFFLDNYVGTHKIGNINLIISTKRMEWDFFTNLALFFLGISCFIFAVVKILGISNQKPS